MADLEKMRKELNKKFPESMVVVPGSAKHEIRKVDVISSGSLVLNRALGVGGFPRGRITEVFGPPSSGKTTLALHAAAEANKMGLWVYYIDIEHALDESYANALGVMTDDVSMFMYSQPDDGEDAFRMLQWILENAAVDSLGVVVIDSLAVIRSRYEAESEIGDSHIGQAARLINQANKALVPLYAKKNVAAIYINQERANIGSYGGGTTTTGGKSTEYFSSIRMRVTRDNSKRIMHKGNEVGVYTKVTTVKNKLAPAYRLAELKVLYGKGIDKDIEIIDELVNRGKLVKSGSWIKLPTGESLGQGAENTLAAHRELCNRLLEESYTSNVEIIETPVEETYSEPVDIVEEDLGA